uniref:UBA domain-containing protein n=1 Tax=Heterorhabditis bacteriophora TaxID=37862 RepID=A0A1I7WI38_HETBA
MSVVLFDERRQPFHAMLQRFYTSGCHQSFCELITGKLAPALCGEHNKVQQLIPEETIRQLMDMGFDREDVMQALMECGTAQEATEWLISRASQQNVAHDNPLAALIRQNIFVEVGSRAELLSENAQENREAGTLSASTHEQSDGRQAAGADSPLNMEDPIEKPIITPLRELKIDVCFQNFKLRPKYFHCLLFYFIFRPMLVFINSGLLVLWRMIIKLADYCNGPRCHGFTHRTVSESSCNSYPLCLSTFRACRYCCSTFSWGTDTYSWILVSALIFSSLLSPVVLWLDLYDKSMRAIKRRKLLKSGTMQLKWSYLADEDRFTGSRSEIIYKFSKKWQPYSPSSLVQLNKAFFAGKTSCVVKIPRKEKDFTVDFTTMKQNDGGINVNAVFAELPDGVDIDIGHIMLSVSEPVVLIQKKRIFCSIILTQGGIAALLHLKCATTPLTSVLTSLIIRQCIEDEAMLTQAGYRFIFIILRINSFRMLCSLLHIISGINQILQGNSTLKCFEKLLSMYAYVNNYFILMFIVVNIFKICLFLGCTIYKCPNIFYLFFSYL